MKKTIFTILSLLFLVSCQATNLGERVQKPITIENNSDVSVKYLRIIYESVNETNADVKKLGTKILELEEGQQQIHPQK